MTRAEIEAGLHLIPEHMRVGVMDWIMHGHLPGSFLRAVISNDLFEAVARSDPENLLALRGWVHFFYNFAPKHCWGSKEVLDTWKGLENVARNWREFVDQNHDLIAQVAAVNGVTFGFVAQELRKALGKEFGDGPLTVHEINRLLEASKLSKDDS